MSDKGPTGGGIATRSPAGPRRPVGPGGRPGAAKRSSDAFFAWLTLPPSSFWVNLKPNEANSIIDPQFARTDAGHVMLDADFRLKQSVARYTNPDTPTGAEFWAGSTAVRRRQAQAYMCVAFRVWIDAAPATVRESADELHILDAPLT